MIKQLLATFVVCLCLVFVQNQNAAAQNWAPTIGSNALWQPGMGGMSDIRNECGSASNFGNCFTAQMRQQGASPQAIAFTRLTGDTGFMRDFRETGRVDIAYVNYPFRANDNQGWLLVNGSPRTIDVDDISLLPQSELANNMRYAELSRSYPNIAIFPGDRSGTGFPVAENMPAGGQRFIVSYKLLNGCHACERVGTVNFAFHFGAAGRFLGANLQSVE